MISVFEAAALLEQRRQFERVPFERYTPELWSLIDEKLPGFGPAWLRELTQRFRIAGAGFQLNIDEGKDWKGRCIIPRPSNALWYIYRSYSSQIVERLFKDYFVWFAEGADDQYGWVFRDDGDPDPQVFLFEHSGWDGGVASESNGFVRSGMRFSEFLAFGARWVPAEPQTK